MSKFIIEYFNLDTRGRLVDLTLFYVEAESHEDALWKFIDCPDTLRIFTDILRLIFWGEDKYNEFRIRFPATFKILKKIYFRDEVPGDEWAKMYMKRYRKRFFRFLRDIVSCDIFDVAKIEEGFFADSHPAYRTKS